MWFYRNKSEDVRRTRESLSGRHTNDLLMVLIQMWQSGRFLKPEYKLKPPLAASAVIRYRKKELISFNILFQLQRLVNDVHAESK